MILKPLPTLNLTRKPNATNTLGFGNPLLDISVKVKNDDLLKKYKVDEDDQIEVTADQIKSLYRDISTCSNHISAGGCAQNTTRVLQWLLNKPNSTIYFGGIGNDEQGKILYDIVQKAGVCTRYMVHKTQSTGTCIALTKEASRSLIAHLGAAECYQKDALSTDESLNILKTVKIIYMEGFFITKRFEVARYIRDLSAENKSVFAFNISGVYLCNWHPNEIMEFARSCDVLFGNINEFEALGGILHIENPTDVAIMLCRTYKEKDKNNPLLRNGKMVVITNGSVNVSCIYGEGKVIEFDVPKLTLSEIEDTTGAGDSFAAGFLAGLLKSYGVEKCLKLGCWAAKEIILQTGCTIPEFVPEPDF